MGLAQMKTRRKIDKDPNNTKWAKDTSSFGQKILRAQGWEPGQYLGAKDAAQADHYTEANASFVRVSIKDDMLGLGFNRAKEEQVTGMNAFQDMLARLNGKSDAVVTKEKEARAALQSSLYCDSKFGPMRFVRGGWLVGDQEQETPVAKLKAEEDAKTQLADVPTRPDSKKRKADEVSDSSSDSSSEDEKAKKRRRKEEKRAARKLKADGKSGSSTATESSDALAATEKEKRRKSKSKSAKDVPNETEDDDALSKKKKKSKKSKADSDSGSSEDKMSSKERKEKKSKKEDRTLDSDAERAAKKEKKRLKKEQKRATEEASKSSSAQPSTTPTPLATGTSTPKSGTSTPILRGHHAVRSKWIKSKSMATLDDAALNQIFMIKAPAS